MWSGLCPHRSMYIQCRVCNGGSICVHGNIKELCDVCSYFEICKRERRKMWFRKNSLKQCHVYYTICSALEKALPHPVSKLIPKNERWNTIQEHIRNLSKE